MSGWQMDGLHHAYSPTSNHIAFWHMPVNHPDYPTALLQTIREPMLVLDDTLRVMMSNLAFRRTFGSTLADTEGRLI